MIGAGGLSTPTTARPAGDTFTLFKSTGGLSGAFTMTNLPAQLTGLGWVTTNLANGVVGVVATVNTSSRNITAIVSGSTLTRSWPDDDAGWQLQEWNFHRPPGI